MPKVKMHSIAAGPNFSAHPGDIKEVTEDHAKALVEGGHASIHKPKAAPETAAKKAPEAAAKKPPETAVKPPPAA